MSETAAAEPKPELKKFGRTRLEAGAYTLDLATLLDVPMTKNGQVSTFRDVYLKLRDSRIKEVKGLEDIYVTEEGEIHLDGKIGEWPLQSTMRKLAELLRQGIDPHHVTWFYYDHDWSRDADESYTFFVVYGNKVVLESCSFNSEEPFILKRKTDDDPIWHNHPFFAGAFEVYWYRKFYTETMTGQFMVLRPDEPILYHFERPQTRNVESHLQVVTLLKTYRLLWVAIPLLIAIAFPSLQYYMAAAAAALGLQLLWTCWATRKIGGS